MPAAYPTGLIAMTFTDIENSSELSERLQAAFEPARQDHFRLLREAAGRWRGVEVSTAGDNLFLVFADAADAVQWAVEAQRALRAHDWRGVPPLRVRMGIHAGEPFFSADPARPDYYGPPVNRAARVMAAAHGGQIVVSDAACELARPALPAEIGFLDGGYHRLKGVGEERLWQALHPDLPREFPPLQTMRPERHNLPYTLTPFVGRDAEIAAWLDLLRKPATRLMTLTGFGGLGKTRAALQLAELSVEDCADGVWWTPVEDAFTPDEMMQRIARMLRLPPQTETPVRLQVMDYLRPRSLLLVIDNTEQVRDAAGAIHELLQSAPGVKCLVTSRRALELRFETVVEVRPLPAGDAERLFVERARACQPDFALDADNAADVAELCRRLEGVPLALELAAARIVGMAPRQMVQRLGERFRLLQSRAPDLPPRQRALRGAIDWSYGLLGDEEKAVFAQVGVFAAGGFTMDDAEAVCDAAASSDVFESVMALRRQSLFYSETDREAQETRFRMLESLREYALERLAETEDRGQAVRRRHAEHFLRFGRARLARFRTEEEAAALRQLVEQSGNLRAAMEWAREAGDPPLSAEIGLVLGVTLQRRGFLTEAVAPIQDSLDALLPLQGAHTPLVARLLFERAGLHLDHGEEAPARQRAQEALILFGLAGDARGQAQAENLLGQAAMLGQDYSWARDHFTRALAHARSVGDQVEAAILHNNLGIVERRDEAGSKAEAARHLHEALALRRALGDRRGVAETLINLGVLAQDQGDLEDAWRCYAEAAGVEREQGHLYGVAIALSNLGEIADAQGEPEQACRLFAASERLFDEVHSPYAAQSARLLEAAAAKLPDLETVSAVRRETRDRPIDDVMAWAMETAAECT